MSPILIPPLARIALGVLSAGAMVGWVVKEVRRIKEEADREKAMQADSTPREHFPTLRHDPQTGDWRVM
jgi:hypothetical protein